MHLEMMQCQENKTLSGRTLADGEQSRGRPSAKRTGDNTARVREFIRSDRRLPLQRGMLHALTHSSISRQVREQM